MRFLASIMVIVMLCGASPASNVTMPDDSYASGCAPGHKTEHFPTVDLWDVIRLIGADYHIKLQPALSVPHVALDTDLICYSRAQVIAFLQGLPLKIIPRGPTDNPIYMLYPGAEGQRLSGTIKYYRLRFATANDDTLRAIKDALPDDAYVAVHSDNNTVIVNGSNEDISRADQFIAAFDVPSSTTTATVGLTSGASAADVVKQLSPMFAQNALVANGRDNSIIVSGTPDVIERAKRMIAGMDTPTMQVELSMKIVDYFPHNDNDSVGTRIGGVNSQGVETPGSGSTMVQFPGGIVQGNITVDLSEQRGFIDVRDEGSIKIQNNQPAILNDATNYPFVVVDPLTGAVNNQNELIGIVGSFTPSISQDGKLISFNLNVTDSEFGGYTPQNQPISIQRQAQTTLTTQDGVPIFVANLFEDETNETIQKVPFLSSVPLIGSLFRYRQSSRREGNLLLLVTPHVIRVK